MLPSAQTILEAAQRRDWYTVLGIAPGARLSPKQERAFRVEVHPDKARGEADDEDEHGILQRQQNQAHVLQVGGACQQQ